METDTTPNTTSTAAPKGDDINPNTYQYPTYPRPKRKYIKKKDKLKGIVVTNSPTIVRFD